MELNNTSNQQVPITAVKRLQQDLIQISKDPVPSVVVTPLPSNILEWHYVVSILYLICDRCIASQQINLKSFYLSSDVVV